MKATRDQGVYIAIGPGANRQLAQGDHAISEPPRLHALACVALPYRGLAVPVGAVDLQQGAEHGKMEIERVPSDSEFASEPDSKSAKSSGEPCFREARSRPAPIARERAERRTMSVLRQAPIDARRVGAEALSTAKARRKDDRLVSGLPGAGEAALGEPDDSAFRPRLAAVHARIGREFAFARRGAIGAQQAPHRSLTSVVLAAKPRPTVHTLARLPRSAFLPSIQVSAGSAPRRLLDDRCAAVDAPVSMLALHRAEPARLSDRREAHPVTAGLTAPGRSHSKSLLRLATSHHRIAAGVPEFRGEDVYVFKPQTEEVA